MDAVDGAERWKVGVATISAFGLSDADGDVAGLVAASRGADDEACDAVSAHTPPPKFPRLEVEEASPGPRLASGPRGTVGIVGTAREARQEDRAPRGRSG